MHFFFSERQPLPGYHPNVRNSAERHLLGVGVKLRPNHRAVIPVGFQCDRFTVEPIAFSSGQDDFNADITLWAVGKMNPNNDFVPANMLDKEGFVKTGPFYALPATTMSSQWGHCRLRRPSKLGSKLGLSSTGTQYSRLP